MGGMRKKNRAERRKVSVRAGVAVVGAAAFLSVAFEGGAAANENGGLGPRLRANVVEPSEISEKNGFAGLREIGGANDATAAINRVESANFAGYSSDVDFGECKSAVFGQTRLVGRSEPDGLLSVETPVETPTPKTTVETSGENGEAGGTGEETSRLKTPILRDEPTSSKRNGGSLGNALVSTFGALAVVLGAFFALVAFLRRTGVKNGGVGSALEVVDSLAVGDKARLLTIRWGNRLILAAKTPEKIAPLAEIADVDEANAMLAEIERRKETAATGGVGAKTAAIWKRGRDAAVAWRTSLGPKGRRQ